MHSVQLDRALATKGLAVITVSLDESDDRAAALSFLQDAGASFDNLVSKFGASTKSADELGIRGEMPFCQLFDRKGQLRYQFSELPDGLTNGVVFSELDDRIRELLVEE